MKVKSILLFLMRNTHINTKKNRGIRILFVKKIERYKKEEKKKIEEKRRKNYLRKFREMIQKE